MPYLVNDFKDKGNWNGVFLGKNMLPLFLLKIFLLQMKLVHGVPLLLSVSAVIHFDALTGKNKREVSFKSG